MSSAFQTPDIDLDDLVDEAEGKAPKGKKKAANLSSVPVLQDLQDVAEDAMAVQHAELDVDTQHRQERFARQEREAKEARALLAETFFKYPAFRPNYGECQFLMACVYGLSVRQAISPGQLKTLQVMRRKAEILQQKQEGK